MLITGKCHCGNMSFTLSWEPDPAEISARACSCSFCIRHGGVWTSGPDGILKVLVRDPTLVLQYAFGTGTAQFHICSRCGVVVVVTSRIDNNVYAVVSVNAFEGVDRSRIRSVPASFNGEGEHLRLARRKRNWIANVEFIIPSLVGTDGAPYELGSRFGARLPARRGRRRRYARLSCVPGPQQHPGGQRTVPPRHLRARYMQSSGFAAVWADIGPGFSEDFARRVDRQLANPPHEDIAAREQRAR